MAEEQDSPKPPGTQPAVSSPEAPSSLREIAAIEPGRRVRKPSAKVFDFAHGRVGQVVRRADMYGVLWDGASRVFQYPAGTELEVLPLDLDETDGGRVDIGGLLEVRITKKADDPLGIVRVSLGGGPEVGGYYCVYRGTKEQAIASLEAAVNSMRAMAEHLGSGEPDVQPDEGKQYA